MLLQIVRPTAEGGKRPKYFGRSAVAVIRIKLEVRGCAEEATREVSFVKNTGRTVDEGESQPPVGTAVRGDSRAGRVKRIQARELH